MADQGRRGQVLDAAVVLFDARGYSNTTMETVAEAVGIRAPSLYNHFSSKQELLGQLVLAGMEDLLAAYDRALATSSDPLEQLHEAMRVQVLFHCHKAVGIRVHSREIMNLAEQDRAALVRMKRDYVTTWEKLLRSVGSPDATIRAHALLDMGAGVAWWFNESGELSADALAQRYARIAVATATADG